MPILPSRGNASPLAYALAVGLPGQAYRNFRNFAKETQCPHRRRHRQHARAANARLPRRVPLEPQQFVVTLPRHVVAMWPHTTVVRWLAPPRPAGLYMSRQRLSTHSGTAQARSSYPHLTIPQSAGCRLSRRPLTQESMTPYMLPRTPRNAPMSKSMCQALT